MAPKFLSRLKSLPKRLWGRLRRSRRASPEPNRAELHDRLVRIEAEQDDLTPRRSDVGRGWTEEQQAAVLSWVDSVDETSSGRQSVRTFEEDEPESPFMQEWRAEMDAITARADSSSQDFRSSQQQIRSCTPPPPRTAAPPTTHQRNHEITMAPLTRISEQSEEMAQAFAAAGAPTRNASMPEIAAAREVQIERDRLHLLSLPTEADRIEARRNGIGPMLPNLAMHMNPVTGPDSDYARETMAKAKKAREERERAAKEAEEKEQKHREETERAEAETSRQQSRQKARDLFEKYW